MKLWPSYKIVPVIRREVRMRLFFSPFIDIGSRYRNFRTSLSPPGDASSNRWEGAVYFDSGIAPNGIAGKISIELKVRLTLTERAHAARFGRSVCGNDDKQYKAVDAFVF